MKRMFLALVWLAVAACGPVDGTPSSPSPSPSPTPPPLPLANGLYEVSAVQLTVDDCDQFAQWDVGTQFGVEVEADTVTVAGVYAMERAAEESFAGEIDQVFEHPGFDCTSRTNVFLDGAVLGENAFEWTVDYTRSVETGSECSFVGVPCESTITLTLSL